ncbi:MAG: HAMP domain-containing histidine kinase [Treponema sp.]|nr:HAMP domain-containing histidine kinase [Treponema sp.]
MTIKRRLFFSNIRMVVITFVVFSLITRIMFMFMRTTWEPNQEVMENMRIAMESYRDVSNPGFFMAWSILIIAASFIAVSIVNSYLTHRMTRRIIKPLEPLGEGVRQIQENNLAYRIDYNDNDEFRPICDAFNEMAEKLEASTVQKEKDEANRRELIAGISHDLRTPLTSIKGCIEGIETGVASTPEMKEKYLSIIKDKAGVLEHVIEQLFLFSKLDMDEFPINLRKTEIGSAISEMIEDLIAEYNERGLKIELDDIPKEIFANVDVFLLRNVIINIIENSVKYKTKERGLFAIKSAIKDNTVILNFSDDGPGIKPDEYAKLFNVFYRADPARNKKGNGGETRLHRASSSGSGLGLAISAKIIERMGGSISARAADEGGLAIEIRLPMVQNNAE